MQITRAVEYGALGLICLARRSQGSHAMIDDISQEEDIPPSFLSKIFQHLSKAGLVRSLRGSGGGFALARNPDQITLLEIFEAIEGKLAFQRCLQETSACERSDSCALCSVFEQAQDQVKDVFTRTTLAELVKRHEPRHPNHATAQTKRDPANPASTPITFSKTGPAPAPLSSATPVAAAPSPAILPN